MLDKNGRELVPNDIRKKVEFEKKEINFYLDFEGQRLFLSDTTMSDVYYVGSSTMDEKGRVVVPLNVREAYSGSCFLPAEKDGQLYMLIIERKKPE